MHSLLGNGGSRHRKAAPSGRRAIGRKTRTEVAKTAKAKKNIAKNFAEPEIVSNFATFFAAPEKESRKEHIERFTIDKSSTRAFVRAAGRKAARQGRKSFVNSTIQHPTNKQRFRPGLSARPERRAGGYGFSSEVVCGVCGLRPAVSRLRFPTPISEKKENKITTTKSLILAQDER